MDKKRKIGRNDPCPCGSGKKYKMCCGAEHWSSIQPNKEIDHFKLNKEIAYKGKVGRMREEFCKHYIKRKQGAFKAIEQRIIKQTATAGETITCHKGCFFCCSQLIWAPLQECEAIVYYLYQHESLFIHFLKEYPRWRQEVRKNESLFQRINQLYEKEISTGYVGKYKTTIMEESVCYWAQNILCPFLRDGVCLIYEVRPWMCASVSATTPAEWCSPLNANKPMLYEVYGPWTKEVPLYGKINSFILFSLPIGVYNILKGGTSFLSTCPGLETLEKEAINDPEVRPIIQQYLKTR